MQYILRLTIAILIFGGFIYYMNSEEEKREIEAQLKLAPYNSEIERYLKKQSVTQPKMPAKGKVIFVDEKTRRVDKLSEYQISAFNTPESPAAIDSVILYSCEYESVGSYTNGSKAMQQVCKFTVIDVASSAWSEWGEIKGPMPPDEIKRKRGRTSDEKGGRAIYSFFSEGGLITRAHSGGLPR